MKVRQGAVVIKEGRHMINIGFLILEIPKEFHFLDLMTAEPVRVEHDNKNIVKLWRPET